MRPTYTLSRPPSPSTRAVRTARRLVVLCVGEALLVGGYLIATDATVLSARYVGYPFVWLNLVVLAVGAVDVPRPTDRRTVVAGVIALGYLGGLWWTSGVIAPGSGGPVSARVVSAIPGWGPMLLVDGPVAVSVIPYEAVGYAGLAVLVYTGIARASAGVLSGVVGLVTCVSCVGPVLVATLSGVLGGASTAVAAVSTSAYAYDLSTALFVLTVAALWTTLR